MKSKSRVAQFAVIMIVIAMLVGLWRSGPLIDAWRLSKAFDALAPEEKQRIATELLLYMSTNAGTLNGKLP